MILSKYFKIKVLPTMNDFESIWCNTNDSGSIIAALEFSEVIILGRFSFMLYIFLIKYSQKDIKLYDYEFKFYQ